MPRPLSKIAPGWWDFTTLDQQLLDDAAKLSAKDIEQLARPGFRVVIYDAREEFFLAEALEYLQAWKESTPDNPAGLCGPIGPTEQLPLVARLVNELNWDVRDGHFWGMDEWIGDDGRPVPPAHPLSFMKADKELCFDRIRPELRMPESHLHFPVGDLAAYSKSYDGIRCVVMQGGQGEVKHWAFNDPPRREGAYRDEPPSPAESRKLAARATDLHPLTIMQNARTSAGGQLSLVPMRAATVGPRETWKAEKVSIWHPGWHDNAFGMRLTALMISKRIADSAVPMSLLADHPQVQFNFYRPAINEVVLEMH
ncbi:MAG: glucosamine-6-phosphate isomerase [Pirellulales bacterium]|nr:glucosamine-6-phosphate isomerase [Pirellulales bacterium]